jgi:glutathione S-transferase
MFHYCSRQEDAMLTLFHAPASRSSRFIWLLEELGAPYEIKYVTIQRMNGEGGPDAANPHPFKQVPALRDGDAVITQSAAIALYLTDAFPAAKMGPIVGDPARGAYLTWLATYAGVLEPSIGARMRPGGPDATEQRSYETLDAEWRGALAAGPYLLGESVSAADILFVSLLQFGRALMPEGKVYDDYLARMTARPALARAMA